MIQKSRFLALEHERCSWGLVIETWGLVLEPPRGFYADVLAVLVTFVQVGKH